MGRWAGRVGGEWVKDVVKDQRRSKKNWHKLAVTETAKTDTFSCKAVIQYEITYGVEMPKHEGPRLFSSYETGLKAMFQFLQLAGHMENLSWLVWVWHSQTGNKLSWNKLYFLPWKNLRGDVTADRRVPSQETQNTVVQLIECTTVHRARHPRRREGGGSTFKTQSTSQNSKWLWDESLIITALGFHKQVG